MEDTTQRCALQFSASSASSFSSSSAHQGNRLSPAQQSQSQAYPSGGAEVGAIHRPSSYFLVPAPLLKVSFIPISVLDADFLINILHQAKGVIGSCTCTTLGDFPEVLSASSWESNSLENMIQVLCRTRLVSSVGSADPGGFLHLGSLRGTSSAFAGH